MNREMRLEQFFMAFLAYQARERHLFVVFPEGLIVAGREVDLGLVAAAHLRPQLAVQRLGGLLQF